MAQQAIRQDLSSDGFYMYKIPERREVSSSASIDLSRYDPPQGDGIIIHPDKPMIPKGKRRPRTKRGGRKKRKRKKTRRKIRKKSLIKKKRTKKRRKLRKKRTKKRRGYGGKSPRRRKR